MFYLLISGNIYRSTGLMQSTVSQLKEALPTCIAPGSIEMKYWKAKLKSVRPIAVEEGEFRTLSSDTIPEFLDFYVNQVIALVLTHKS